MSLPLSANPLAGSPQFCIDDILNVVDISPIFYSHPISHASHSSPTPCPTPSPALSGITLTQTPSSCEASLPPSPEKQPSKLPRKHSTRKNSNHVPRPCNKFILFRSFYIKENRETLSEIERDHSVLSKMAGQTWNRMTEEEQEPWADLAKERDRLHKKQHPDYRYSPKRRARPTRRTNRNGRDSAERIEKIAALLRENRPQEDIVATVRAIDEELASRQAGTRQADAPQAAWSSGAVLGSRSADDSGSPTKVDPVFVEPVLPPAAEWAYVMSPVCLLLNFGFVVIRQSGLRTLRALRISAIRSRQRPLRPRRRGRPRSLLSQCPRHRCRCCSQPAPSSPPSSRLSSTSLLQINLGSKTPAPDRTLAFLSRARIC